MSDRKIILIVTAVFFGWCFGLPYLRGHEVTIFYALEGAILALIAFALLMYRYPVKP